MAVSKTVRRQGSIPTTPVLRQVCKTQVFTYLFVKIYIIEVDCIQFETNQDKGRAGLSYAIAYFGSNGYTVSIPLNDTQWYDLIVEKDNAFSTVQCKATGSYDNSIQLRSLGGTNGGVYDNVLNHPVDYLFCLDKDKYMYLIPVDDIRKYGYKNTIKLYHDKPPKYARNKADTTKYIVSL